MVEFDRIGFEKDIERFRAMANIINFQGKNTNMEKYGEGVMVACSYVLQQLDKHCSTEEVLNPEECDTEIQPEYDFRHWCNTHGRLWSECKAEAKEEKEQNEDELIINAKKKIISLLKSIDRDDLVKNLLIEFGWWESQKNSISCPESKEEVYISKGPTDVPCYKCALSKSYLGDNGIRAFYCSKSSDDCFESEEIIRYKNFKKKKEGEED